MSITTEQHGFNLTAYPTSGHIGSFYFGGPYQNGEGVFDTPILYILPSPGPNAGVDADSDTISYLTISPASGIKAKGDISFMIDFVGKKTQDKNFPKFCGPIKRIIDEQGHTCPTCKTADEERAYNAQITGGNALSVDFYACTIINNTIYDGYKADTYKWYFDYKNEPNTYVTYHNTPYASHIYCGGYLEEYDVRLCVEFK